MRWWHCSLQLPTPLACLTVAITLLATSGGDLEDEMYHLALKSKYLVELDQDRFDGFLSNSPEPYQLVLFHIGTCHICKNALPALELVAREFSEQEVPIVVGHVDCTRGQSVWKNRLGFDGFPHLHLWHRPNDGQKNDGIALNELVGFNVRITPDELLLLEASRKAGMSKKRDAVRLKALGAEAEVLEVDLRDLTASLKVLRDGAAVWFPLEVLSAVEGGKPLPPIQRPTALAYRPTSWKREDMQDFAVRMMRPPVTVLDDLSKLQTELKNEAMAALVLCAPEVPSRFLALARPWQDKHRAFHVPSPDACPVAGAEAGELLVVYSPPGQQWAAKGPPSAAVVVAGAKVLHNDTLDIAEWFSNHRFPGILNVSYDNFPEVVNAERKIAILAVDMSSPKQKKMVQQKIRDAAAPKKSKKQTQGGGLDVYKYSSNSTYWGVMDGTLNGLDSFGIRRGSLPRVVIFEKGGRWVEDEEYLRVEHLTQDLARSGELWRMQGGPYGWFLGAVRMLWRSFLMYDKLAQDVGGTPARVVLALMWAMVPIMCARSIIQAFQAAFQAEDEPEVTPKDTSKED